MGPAREARLATRAHALRVVATAASAALAAIAAIARPEVARACSVCFGGGESDWTGAFFAGTVIMLLLPPAIIGIAGFTIYRAIKRQEARQAAASAPAHAK
jgi:hypothetical protein